QHPRIKESVTEEMLLNEHHSIVSLEDVGSFSAAYYKNTELEDLITYEGTDLNSVLNLVSKTYSVAIAPRWLV
ncbi:transcriptional regulator LeuO, partial [Escherichia coli]|nr:transcriptional regulator LeuO [Escherichia coli]